MPLITFAGRPCTGKTTHAKALAAVLRERGHAAHVVNEESEGVDKVTAYQGGASEKIARSTLKAAAVRLLTRRAFVIFDSLNYFKSTRYEMYRFAVEQGTTSCVVWVDAPKEDAKRWNQARAHGYTDDMFEDLWGRFEVPNERARWDAPLFLPLPAASAAAGAADDVGGEEYLGDYGHEPRPDDVLEGSDSEVGGADSVGGRSGREPGVAAAAAAAVAAPGAEAVRRRLGAGARATRAKTTSSFARASSFTPAAARLPPGGDASASGAGVVTAGSAGGAAGSDTGSTGAVTEAEASGEGSGESGAGAGAGAGTGAGAGAGAGGVGAVGGDADGPPVLVPTADDGVSETLTLPFDAIIAALTQKQRDTRINHSTIKTPLSDTNLLHQLDKVTQEVVAAVGAGLRLAMVGDSFVVPKSQRKVVLLRKPTVVELRRLRRQFLKVSKNHPPSNKASETALGDAFVSYINSALASS